MQLKLLETPMDYKVEASSTFISNMQSPVHRWFRYSAGFSAEWAKSILQVQLDQNIVILDPFAGSGTTLLAADSCGHNSIGVEAHPFVARIAQTKLKWDSDRTGFEKQLLEISSLAKAIFDQETFVFENIPQLIQKSYSPEAAQKLYALRKAQETCADESAASELAWLTLTAILRSCSFVGTAPWQYVLPQKRKAKVVDPFDAWNIQGQIMLEDMKVFKHKSEQSLATVIQNDARTLDGVASNSIDLVITSPPYANNYDYADATRLEMSFWGMIENWGDLQQSVRQHLIRSCSQHTSIEKLILDELLSHPNLEPIIEELAPICRQLAEERNLHGGKKHYHTMIAAYFSDMARVWKALRRVCKPTAQLCFVIGDSAPYGVYIPVDRWFSSLALASGFSGTEFTKTRDRNIKWRNRKHTVLLKEGQLWVK